MQHQLIVKLVDWWVGLTASCFIISDYSYWKFLNQARASLRPACAWFFKIDPVRIVGMCVCESAPEAINN